MRSKLATCVWSIFVLYLGFLLRSSYAQNYYHGSESCQLPDGRDATCVNVQDCQPVVDLLKTLRRPHPPAVTKKLSAYKCENKHNKGLYGCCPSEPIILDPQSLYHNREVAPDGLYGCCPSEPIILDPQSLYHNREVAPDGLYGCCPSEPIILDPQSLYHNREVAPDGFYVCCPSEPIILDPQSLYHNREVAPDVSNHKNLHLLPNKCGFLDDSERITHGEDAHLIEFPWMALLQYKTSHGLKFLCGGTIINFNYILTAAHCLGLASAELVGVRVGEYSTKNTTDCEEKNNEQRTKVCNPPVQDLRIEQVITHPQFAVKEKNILNDIALLRVSTMRKEVNVYPVCLPVGDIRDKAYNNVVVTGWGLTNSRTKESADILQKVGLPIVNERTCAATYSESNIELTKTQICAGGQGKKASCSGDSGGPMMVPAFIEGNFIYVQYGIVSVGPIFCEKESNYPGVYTLVKFYMDWILDNMTP